MIQAVIAQNLYRLWFSIKPMIGITWWNVVDGCGYKGEPSVSGLFTRNMDPKPSFYALNNLINHEWKTNLTVKADKNGQIKFRGYKGNYKITWTDKSGNQQSIEYHEELGVTAMKLKAAVMDPMEEVKVLQLCREKLGDDFGLRIDPNGVWSVATAVKAGHRMVKTYCC